MKNVELEAASHAMNAGLLAELAEFAKSIRLEIIPPEVIRQAKLTIIDTVACMVAGSRDDVADSLLEAESQRSSFAEASVIGVDKRLDIQAAIRVNAYMGDIFELNDLTGGHAGIAVVATSLALAESLGSSGRDLLEAVVCGIEVTSRVYSAYYPHMKPYQETGITPPGIPSTIGAAAAAARLYGFDEVRTAHTLEIAASLAGWCPAEVIFGQGGSVKPMLFGSWPGSIAVQAAFYARAGLDGPKRLLESPIGLYATLATRYERKALSDPGFWYLSRPRRKQHACCGYIHSALDAVIALRNEGIDIGKAMTIEIRVPQYIIPGVSKSRPPEAPTEARFHAEYCLAIALSGANAIRPEHSEHFSRYLPEMKPYMERIRVVPNDALTHYHQSVVTGFDEHGKELFSKSVRSPKGAPDNPMSDEEIVTKFRMLTRDCLSGDQENRYIASIDKLEHATDCVWIIRSFNPANQ